MQSIFSCICGHQDVFFRKISIQILSSFFKLVYMSSLYIQGIYPCHVSHSVMSDSVRSHGLQPARLPCPWNSLGKNTGVGSYYLLQGIFPTQGSNLGFLHCGQIPSHLRHQGSLINFFPNQDSCGMKPPPQKFPTIRVCPIGKWIVRVGRDQRGHHV